MPRYVALLRGINVGGHRVKMICLRELFEDIGLTAVSTFIASGNVIFSTDSKDAGQLCERIEEHLAEQLGYAVQTFLRSPEELSRVTAYRPPAHDESRALYVAFLRGPADDKLQTRFAMVDSPQDRFTFHGCELYWSIAGNLSESSLFGAGFEKAMGDVRSTMRNMTSLQRLVAKLAQLS